jgi:hypothetical protein
VQGVLLADGTTVQMPEDLHPLVDPDSVTAQSAERSQRARSHAGGLLASGLIATGVGVGLLFPALSSVGDRASGGSSGDDNGLLWISVGLGLAGAVLALIAGYGPRRDGLAGAGQRLRRPSTRRCAAGSTCARTGLGVVDCATQTPAGPVLQPMMPGAPMLPPPSPTAPAPWGAPPPPTPTPTPTPTAVGAPITL